MPKTQGTTGIQVGPRPLLRNLVGIECHNLHLPSAEPSEGYSVTYFSLFASSPGAVDSQKARSPTGAEEALYSSELSHGLVCAEWSPLDLSLFPHWALHGLHGFELKVFNVKLRSGWRDDPDGCEACVPLSPGGNQCQVKLASTPVGGARWTHSTARGKQKGAAEPFDPGISTSQTPSITPQRNASSLQMASSVSTCGCLLREDEILSVAVDLATLRAVDTSVASFPPNTAVFLMTGGTFLAQAMAMESQENDRDQLQRAWDLGGRKEAEGKLKVVEWQAMEDGIVHLRGLRAAMAAACSQRDELGQLLGSALEARAARAAGAEAAQEARKKVAAWQRQLASAQVSLREEQQELQRGLERLLLRGETLQASVRAMTAAKSRLQEAGRLLDGEGGRARLLQLRRHLAWRRRRMICQVAALYPLQAVPAAQPRDSLQGSFLRTDKGASSKVQQQIEKDSLPEALPELPSVSSDARGTALHESNRKEAVGPALAKFENVQLSIAGLPLPIPPPPGFSGRHADKLETQEQATALGYAAYAVTLTAGILGVSLRYPIIVCGSHSRVRDPLRPVDEYNEKSILFQGAAVASGGLEFPLHLNGANVSQFSIAVFLLNKDIDQLLNTMGLPWVGPNQTLHNLHKLVTAVQSGACGSIP